MLVTENRQSLHRHSPFEEERSAETYASVNAREVKISAVFFEMDVEKSKKVGVDWKILLNGESADVGGVLRTEGQTGTGGEIGIDFR